MDYKKFIIDSFTKENQRVFVKIYVYQDHSARLIHSNLTKFLGSKAVSLHTVNTWRNQILAGTFQDKGSSGGDTSDHALHMERVDQIKSCFDESRHWSLRSLAASTGIPKSTVQRIVSDELQMRKVLGKWVPHLLTEDQVQHRILACEANLEVYKKDHTVLRRTLSIDESWVSLYMQPDRNQSRQYLYPGEEPDEQPRENIHGKKRMLIMAVDFQGIAFYKLCDEQTTVNGESYKNFLAEYLPKWLGKRDPKHLRLHHDNARPHTAKVVKDFLAEKKIILWKQPPYSPDISPLDYGCFAELKRQLRGTRHSDWDEFEANLKTAVEKLNSEGKITAIPRLAERWQRVIDLEGAYL